MEISAASSPVATSGNAMVSLLKTAQTATGDAVEKLIAATAEQTVQAQQTEIIAQVIDMYV